MVEVISQTEQIARKQYSCDGKEYLTEGIEYFKGKIPFSDLRKLAKIKAENHKILKGAVYVKQFNKMDGDVYIWKCRKDTYELYCKYNLLDID